MIGKTRDIGLEEKKKIKVLEARVMAKLKHTVRTLLQK